MNKLILLIAGSDSSSNAGLQKDLKTTFSLKTKALNAITCLTIQNNKKVSDIFYPPIEFLEKQILSALEENISAIKIGMIGSKENIKIINKILKEKAQNIPIILDPIVKSSSGFDLIEEDSLTELKNLISNSYLITPNINEASILSGITINDFDDVKKAAKELKKSGAKNILITGGHLNQNEEEITHLLLKENNEEVIFTNKRIKTKAEPRGTGCMLSTAIACFLNKGFDLEASTQKADDFVNQEISSSSLLSS